MRNESLSVPESINPFTTANSTKLGFFSVRVDRSGSMDDARERMEQASTRVKAGMYAGGWALSRTGVEFKKVYSKAFLDSGYSLENGGYEALVLRYNESPDYEKVFYRSLHDLDASENEHIESLRSNLSLLQSFILDRVTETRFILKPPPLKRGQHGKLPTAIQKIIPDIHSPLDTLLEDESWLDLMQREPALRGDIRDIANGSIAMHAEFGAIPDLLGEGNVLVFDTGSRLRATLVDTSIFGHGVGIKAKPNTESLPKLSLKKAEDIKSVL